MNGVLSQEWKVGLTLQSQYNLLYQQNNREKTFVISMKSLKVFDKIELPFQI